MNKIIALILALMLVLCGCGSKSEEIAVPKPDIQEVEVQTDDSTKLPEPDPEPAVGTELSADILETYCCPSSRKLTFATEFKNTSAVDVDAEIQFIIKDENGGVLITKTGQEWGIGPNETVLIYANIYVDEFDYTRAADFSAQWECSKSDITYSMQDWVDSDYSMTSKNVIVEAINRSDHNADGHAQAIFFKDGTVVDISSCLVQVPAGTQKYCTISTRSDFDAVKVYVHNRT